ncbi:MAG: SRPBCC domain-containing protein, partial [Chloroflexi bacterium]|nr:SRPBCC domain-containing protein [Chloroflexota bacterium]
GVNLELEEGRRIVQAWRTHEFAADEPDSRLELRFDPHPDGTLLTLRHTELPEHGMQYKQGWVEAYFEPMKEWFGGK